MNSAALAGTRLSIAVLGIGLLGMACGCADDPSPGSPVGDDFVEDPTAHAADPTTLSGLDGTVAQGHELLAEGEVMLRGRAVLPSGEPLASAHSARITGRFVDGVGAPVAEATVLHRVWPGSEFPCRTDAAGRFAVIVEWPLDHRDTWYECSITTFGFERWKLSDDLHPGDERDLGTVVLSPGGGVTGTVLGAYGPLSDANVVVVPVDLLPEPATTRNEDGPGWRNVIGGAQSDAGGAFRIDGLPPGEWGVWARHETTWWASGRVFTVLAGEYAVVPALVLEDLPASHRIEGKIVGPEGEPVGGVVVKTGIHRETTIESVTATTDLNGHFVLYLVRIPDESLDVGAEPPGDEYWRGSARRVCAGTRDLLLQLPRMSDVELEVIDPDGHPVEVFGWRLQVDEGGRLISMGVPDAMRPGGRAFVRVPDGLPVKITVRSDAFRDTEIDVRTEVATPIRVTLRPHPAVAGIVTFKGQPVSDAHVDFIREEPDYVNGLIGDGGTGLYYAVSGGCKTTDDRGRFRLVVDFPHLQHLVRAWTPGHSPVVLDSRSTGDDVTIELGVGGSLVGTLQLPGGTDPKGIILRATRRQIDSLECDVGRRFKTTLSSVGAYRFDHLEPGPWMISAEVPPGLAQALGWDAADVRACADVPFILVAEDGVTTRSDLALTQPKGPCLLRGRLTVGELITEGYCYLRLGGTPVLGLPSSSVDEDGCFTLATRRPGTYRLVIHAGPGHHRYKIITDLVELAEGENTWDRDLPESLWEQDGIRLDGQ